jgi:hypothetical protein
VLERLEEGAAEVRLTSNFLLLYERTAHLAKRIRRADYVALYESIWRDRASKAGWAIDFAYGEAGSVTFRLTRSPG